MLPILARAASRAAARNVPVRNISMMRSLARSFELHPYERIAASSKSAPGDYSKMAKNAAGRFVFFAPGISLLLGWPFISQKLLEGHL